jgi:hypothetical protein
MLKLAGKPVDAKMIDVRFDKPETIQPRTTAETRQMNVNAGMPLVTVLREEGKDEEFIARMLLDKKAEAARNEETLANSLLNAERKFNAG